MSSLTLVVVAPMRARGGTCRYQLALGIEEERRIEGIGEIEERENGKK
jgi:hypothetical protein